MSGIGRFLLPSGGLPPPRLETIISPLGRSWPSVSVLSILATIFWRSVSGESAIIFFWRSRLQRCQSRADHPPINVHSLDFTSQMYHRWSRPPFRQRFLHLFGGSTFSTTSSSSSSSSIFAWGFLTLFPHSIHAVTTTVSILFYFPLFFSFWISFLFSTFFSFSFSFPFLVVYFFCSLAFLIRFLRRSCLFSVFRRILKQHSARYLLVCVDSVRSWEIGRCQSETGH